MLKWSKLFAIAAVLGIVSMGSAYGQLVPYKSQGTGIYEPGTGNYGGAGIGRLLGRHSLAGSVIASPTDNPLVFVFSILSSNPQETIAANGDKIYFSATGQVQLIPLEETFTVFSAVWSGEFVVEGGTGQFASIKPGPQPLKVVAVNNPFTFADPQWSFNWTLDGFVRLR